MLSALTMFVEPDGPGYDIDVIGHINTNLPSSSNTGSSSGSNRARSAMLHSDKNQVVWGGVALGKSV